MRTKGKKVLLSALTLVTLGLGSLFTSPLQAQAQTCGSQPVDLVLMLDRTASVSSTARNNERDAANSLLSTLATLDVGHRVSIGRFGNSTSEIVSGGDLQVISPANLATIQALVTTALSSSSGNTNLVSAINTSQAQLVSNGIPANPDVIVLISDGEANVGGSTGVSAGQAANNAATVAKATGTRIITVAYDSSGNSTSDVNGRALLAQIATQPSDDDTVGTVSDTERNTENADGDDFFIAPTAEGVNQVFAQVSQTLSCNDNNPCTTDVCGSNNICSFQVVEGCTACRTSENCNDNNPCTNDICGQNATCEYSNVTAGTCTDGNACTGPDFCSNGACSSGPALSIDDFNACTADSCDSVSGVVHTPIDGCQSCQSAEDCGDANVCNGIEACVEGVCQAGAAPTLDDSNPCTVDSCSAEGGVQHTAIEGCVSCNVDNAAVACNDQNPCTADSCSQNGVCQNDVLENGTSCADGDACNGSETCQRGTCAAAAPVTCDDDNRCTIDTCNSVEGDVSCSNVPNTELCPIIEVACGNGILEEAEQCDDGNTNDGDGCSEICTTEEVQPVCGNAIQESGEECDDGNLDNLDSCLSDCTFARCGDGIVQQSAGEECDPLDDTESSASGLCTEGCRLNNDPVCGNATLEGDETCDDGNLVNGDGCDTSCAIEPPATPVCGNEILESGEACDDANLVDGDGCSSTCTTEQTPSVTPTTPGISTPNDQFQGSGDVGVGGCSLTQTGSSSKATLVMTLFALVAMFAVRSARKKNAQ